jgi:pyruvate/2-oxoglutarate dehydrogenase complex dihydrolipoamide acyltransferase (E2) component
MLGSAFRVVAVTALAGSLLAACGGGGGDDADAADTASAQTEESAVSAESAEGAAPAASAAAQPPAAENSSAPLAVEDIDRWQRGMAAELEAVRAAGEQLKSARTGGDTVTAMMGANETATRDAGAAAAGLSPDRYQFVRSTLSGAAGSLSPLEMEMKVSDMPPAMVEQMKQARESGITQLGEVLPPPVVEALRARAAELRKQDLELTGARLRAMGAARGD